MAIEEVDRGVAPKLRLFDCRQRKIGQKLQRRLDRGYYSSHYNMPINEGIVKYATGMLWSEVDMREGQ